MEISIKKPCHENWDSFTPNEQGAFCGKCVKTVVDFTNKSIEEIKDYFIGKQDEKICGRFEKAQLTSLSFDAFFNEFKGFSFTKRFTVIVYFTFGMWLFNASSASAQTTIHEKGDVQVIKVEPQIMGGARYIEPKKDSVSRIKPKPKQNIKGKVIATKQNEINDSLKLGEIEARPIKREEPTKKMPAIKK